MDDDDLQYEDENADKKEKPGLTGVCLGSVIVISYIFHKVFFPDDNLFFLIGTCAILVLVYILTTTLEKKLKVLKEARLNKAWERVRRGISGTWRKSDRKLIEEDIESRLDIGGDLAQFIQAITDRITRLRDKADRLNNTPASLKLDDLESLNEALSDARLKVMARVTVFFGQKKIEYQQARLFLNETDGLLHVFARSQGDIITALDQIEWNMDQAAKVISDGTPRTDIGMAGQQSFFKEMNDELERLTKSLDEVYQAMREIVIADIQ